MLDSLRSSANGGTYWNDEIMPPCSSSKCPPVGWSSSGHGWDILCDRHGWVNVAIKYFVEALVVAIKEGSYEGY